MTGTLPQSASKPAASSLEREPFDSVFLLCPLKQHARAPQRNPNNPIAKRVKG